MKKVLLLLSHSATLGLGFALGIYFLPILTQPEGPSSQELNAAVANAQYEGVFKRDLKGSDFLHWGQGELMLGEGAIAFKGELAPGPDYKLYLSPVYVEDEQSFLENKRDMVQIGAIKTFDGFVLTLPQGIDLSEYSTAVVWCESFSEFITSTRYQ